MLNRDLMLAVLPGKTDPAGAGARSIDPGLPVRAGRAAYRSMTNVTSSRAWPHGILHFFIYKSRIMFSTTCAHALRALAYLAEIPEGVYVLGRDIASAAEIPANYLSKILLALRNVGFIATARGSAGGYRLSRHPSEISLLQVVELFEKSPIAEACFLNGAKPCSKDNRCMAHVRWCPVRDAYAAFLASTNLEEITQKQQRATAAWRARDAVPDPKSRGGVRL